MFKKLKLWIEKKEQQCFLRLVKSIKEMRDTCQEFLDKVEKEGIEV